MALSPLILSTPHHHSPQNYSVLFKKGLPSLARKSAETIPVVQKFKRRSSVLCSVRGGTNGLSAAAAAASPPIPAEEVITGEPVYPLLPADQIDIKRSDFPPPPHFIFGAGSSAYQVEGACGEEYGKGESIWDTFTREHIDSIDDKSSGVTAIDAYHRYKDDIKIMKEMGLESYRFSISWTRILPDGTKRGGINEQGIAYYNELINELHNNDIIPFVTLFHWDTPQNLETKYGGFKSKNITNDFKDFAEICFNEFGDRVKHWSTLNEPCVYTTINGEKMGFYEERPNSATEYTVTHNLILAHAEAAKLYKDHFQATQKGEVGITLNCDFYKPHSESYYDKQAAERYLDFLLGWYLEPLVYGDYPFVMRALAGKRIPKFTNEEKELIKSSYDFIGINYYSCFYTIDKPVAEDRDNYKADKCCDRTIESMDNRPIGEQHGRISVVPEGIRDLLTYIKVKYGDLRIYITENGTCELNNPELKVEEAREDYKRRDYIANHLAEVRAAMQGDNHINVKGYFVWSLADNFEWFNGYTMRFGIIYMDYQYSLKRIPKVSAEWYTKFLKF